MERMPISTESPCQTCQNCVIVFCVCVCGKLIPKKRSKNRTPWPLTSSIPRWNRKVWGSESRRVARIDSYFPWSYQMLKLLSVFFFFLVRSAWKRMQRLYSLVIIHHSDGKSTLWRCGLWISIVCKTGCLWWWAVTWFSPQRWGWLKRGSTSVITPIGIHLDEVYFAKKQTRRPPQFFPCFHRTFGNHVLYRLLSYLKCDRSKSSRWSLMHLNQMEEAAYSTDANGVFYVIINKNKEETERWK